MEEIRKFKSWKEEFNNIHIETEKTKRLVYFRISRPSQIKTISKTIPEKIEREFTRNDVIYYKNKVTGRIHIIENEVSFYRLKDEIAA